MFVSRSMIKEVITISRKTSVLDAQKIMKANRVRHLPVVEEDGRLVGIVTDRDLRSVYPSIKLPPEEQKKELQRLHEYTIEDIMTREVVSIAPTSTIQDALLLIEKTRVGAFPVVDECGILIGIISVRDLLGAFIKVMGVHEPGTLLGIVVEEKVGELKKIVDVISEEKISLGSILVARYWDQNKRAVFPYLLALNVSRVKKRLQAMGYELIDPLQWHLGQGENGE
jgi:acetoin utilization protein AcuB